jgi:hypothetical protein
MTDARHGALTLPGLGRLRDAAERQRAAREKAAVSELHAADVEVAE